jgi:hypothetical protein
VTKVAPIPCSGHIESPPDDVASCTECGHPTDRRCVPCALRRSRSDERRSETVVDVNAIANAAMDRSAICPCCAPTHQHIADPWDEAMAS